MTGCSSEAIKMPTVKVLKVKVLKVTILRIKVLSVSMGLPICPAMLLMTGCSSEAVKMPVVIAHQLASGSAQADTGVQYI